MGKLGKPGKIGKSGKPGNSGKSENSGKTKSRASQTENAKLKMGGWRFREASSIIRCSGDSNTWR